MQGAVIGRLTARYPESSLLLVAIGVSSLVGLGQVSMPEYSRPRQGLGVRTVYYTRF